MKKKILVLGISLSIILTSTVVSFAEVGQTDIIGVSNAVNTTTVLNGVTVATTDSITLTSCKRVNANYARMVFKNNNSALRTDTAHVYNAGTLATLSNFSISIPANSSKTYDVYVGSCSDLMIVLDNNSTYFKTI